MSRLRMILLCLLVVPLCHAQMKDSERLGIAIEYFQSGKYQEARNILLELDKSYTLNPRFRAYLGVCCFYEWDFTKAVEVLDSVIPQLTTLSPQERSVYAYAAAESHFVLAHYGEAIPYFVQVLSLCHPDERGEAYFKLAFCHLSEEDYVRAYGCLEQSLSYYERYQCTPEHQGRMVQIRNMLLGAEARVKRLIRE